jgi:gamma-glutamyltranspeptidase
MDASGHGGWAVSTPHVLASQAAADVLRVGGTAVDGALAAATVLAVVYPNQCSLGGDLIALVGTPDGEAHVVNGSGRAPAAVDVDALRQRYPHLPVDGALAVTVPGVVDGWHELARRFGRRPVPAALAVAAGLAREGVPVSAGLARDLAREAGRIAADPGLAQVLMADGRVLTAGQTLRQSRLADTLEVVAADPRAFYAGEIAASIVGTLREHGSAMTVDDFATHHGTVTEPLTAAFGSAEYLSSGDNTQGGFFLAGLRVVEILAARLGRALDPLGPDAGVLARVFARLAAERDVRLGDRGPDDGWSTSDTVAERLADDILTAAGPARAAPGRKPSGDTVAIVAADAEGQWACLIQSVFHAFGAGLLDPGTGVLLHNRGAAFGLRPGSAGELAGGRRPPHTLMPVLVRAAAGGFVGAHGTMGGRAQPQIHTHLALHLALGRSASAAVEAPRWIVGQMEAGPAGTPVVQVESDVPDAARAALADTGLPAQILAARDDGAGHAQVVRAVPGLGAAAGRLCAASDPRADGAALTAQP